jgi:triphosphoribosyl-dephospho-CoA synthase
MQRVFLSFLAEFEDSHIVRKHGAAAAQAVAKQASQWLERVVADGTSAQAGLVRWDADLKASGINPGTSADLAVATVFTVGALFSRFGHVATRAV